MIQKLGRRLEDFSLLSALLLAVLGAIFAARLPGVDIFVGGAIGFILVFAAGYMSFVFISFIVRSLTFICTALDERGTPVAGNTKAAWSAD